MLRCAWQPNRTRGFAQAIDCRMKNRRILNAQVKLIMGGPILAFGLLFQPAVKRDEANNFKEWTK